jgi:hypothetical protein
MSAKFPATDPLHVHLSFLPAISNRIRTLWNYSLCPFDKNQGWWNIDISRVASIRSCTCIGEMPRNSGESARRARGNSSRQTTSVSSADNASIAARAHMSSMRLQNRLTSLRRSFNNGNLLMRRNGTVLGLGCV